MKLRPIFLSGLAIAGIIGSNIGAQTPPTGGSSTNRKTSVSSATGKDNSKNMQLQSFKFEGADLNTVMEQYCTWTDKIYLMNESLNATITLKAERLTIPECIEALDAILAMNNIAVVPMGEKFLKVVPANAGDMGGQGLPTGLDPEVEYSGSNRLATQVIPLQHVSIPEIQAAVQHLMHGFGKIMALQRSNCLLITDTEANILRIRELIDFMDQASARIEPRIYRILYAEAATIASKLNEIIQLATADMKQAAAAPAAPRTAPAARVPPGVIRARAAAAKAAASTQATISQTESASDVIIHGTVKVMSDERTNIIIIFSQEENFEFFDQIVEVLDVEVEPAITFEVVNLEYADAEELAKTINELVGAATSASEGSDVGTSGTKPPGTPRGDSGSMPERSVPRGTDAATGAPTGETAAIENLSKLSESTKILADKRSNAILLMGRKSDIAAIKNVIASLDVMLEQVIIEAAIFEIGLNDKLSHGLSWLYRSQDGNKVGAWDGKSLSTNSVANLAAGALTYYQNVTGINTELAINLAATDDDSRLLATPVIMTTDNTEATLSIGEQRPVVTSTDTYGVSSGTQRSSYEYKDIGIQLTVTPRINPQRLVVMEISQQADQIGGTVTIDNNQVPIILNREFKASVSVPDRGTIALGGLLTTEKSDSISKIPILGDIPLIGRYLFSSVLESEIQRELLILMTPYVMTDEEQMVGETERLYKGTSLSQEDWAEGWSESKLRTLPDESDPNGMNENLEQILDQMQK